jgi:uncharacterized membrane protein YeaQ/YmgE (transglycosylase-associated protein family)
MELITFILWLCVIGLIVRAIARLLVPGRQAMGLVGTALAGIAGSFVAGPRRGLIGRGRPMGTRRHWL